MAVFDAIFKDADICLAVLACASDDEIALGDETETGHLGASRPILFGNGVNYFFHLDQTSEFYFCLSAGWKRHRGSSDAVPFFSCFGSQRDQEKLLLLSNETL